MLSHLPPLLYYMEVVVIGSVTLICIAVAIGMFLRANLLSQIRPNGFLARSLQIF